MKTTANKTVFVGLSGGVDSSVAALRLKQQGYNVVGVFIKVWQPDFLTCNWERERLDAMRVAAKLSIPFLTCDAEEVYKKDVADYFIAEYLAGRTPNPDVMCNKYVKFGAFMTFADTHNADFIATGHYAQNVLIDQRYQLKRGIDKNKDQSYFLWTLTQAQLARTLFPIGNNQKSDIRAQAAAAGLLTAHKKDSQGICFLGHVDIGEFLSHYVSLASGDVLDTTGNCIGTHAGALIYTLGQRQGFTLTEQKKSRTIMYVVDRDFKRNTITVAATRPAIASSHHLILSKCNFIQPLQTGQTLGIQTRYRQTPLLASIFRIVESTCELALMDETEKPALGQSCVLYEGENCLGGGIISAYVSHDR